MKIEICDICKRIPDSQLVEIKLVYFMSGEDWFGRPKRTKCICSICLDKIFDK